MTLDELPPHDRTLLRRWVDAGRIAESEVAGWLAPVAPGEVSARGGLAGWLAAAGRLPGTISGEVPTQVSAPPDASASPRAAAGRPTAADATVRRSQLAGEGGEEAGTVMESWDSAERARTAAMGGRRPTAFSGRIPTRIDRFVIEDLLGRGGMGVVYRAFDPQMERRVALKILSVTDRDDQEKLERFLREAQTAGSLRHPHIVAVYEMGTYEDAPYVVMEMVEGESLIDAVSAGEGWPLTDRMALFRDVARAVAHAHAHRVVHRDLKPSNILVDAARKPCVLDFGLARRLDAARRLTAEGQLMGTPGYMPPEQIEGQPGRIGPHSDVFALGAILYEMLAGRLPYGGHTQMEVISRTLRGEFPPLRSVRAELPADLETICARCLEPEIERRYPDAGALADELDRWLKGEPILARPLGRAERFVRLVRRRREAALMIVGALLLLAFVAAGNRVYRGVRLKRALAEARRLRAEARAVEARDAYRRALDLDAADGEAREGAAWADAEHARVLAEAEAARAEAEAGRVALRKAGLVGNVLSRWMLLVEPLRALEAVHYDAAVPAEEKRERAAPAWARVERFRSETPPDDTSQATMLALSGWARRLAGHEAEGIAWIDRARELDPALPYGALLRAMIVFGRLVLEQPLPVVTQRITGVEFGDAPGETAELASMRAEAERWLAEVEQAAVWGEGVAQDFRRAAEALRHLQQGRYVEADEAFTQALGGGLSAFRTDLLFARAKARYLCKRFAAAVEDMEEARQVRPGQPEVWFYLGWFRSGASLDAVPRGIDACDGFAAAAAEYGRAVELSPRWEEAWRYQAMLLHDLGKAQARRGDDPRPTFRRSLDAYARALELRPRENLSYHNRGVARLSLADAERERGGEAKEILQAALADFDESLRLDAAYHPSHASRGAAFLALGDLEDGGGADPRPWYRKAIADYEAALAAAPGDLEALHNRGVTYSRLGEAEDARGLDARPSLDAAIAALRAVVGQRGEQTASWNSLGISLMRRAGIEKRAGEDPRTTYREALDAFGQALKNNPEYVLAYDGRGVTWRALAEAEGAGGGDPAEALAQAEKDHEAALARNPEYLLGHYNLGLTRRAQAEALRARRRDARAAYRAALDAFGKVVRINPEFVLGRYYLADTLRLLGEVEGAAGEDGAASFQAAVDAFDEALKRRPDHVSSVHGRATAWFRLGAALEKKGEDPRPAYEAAAADFGEVLRLDPTGLGNFAYRGLAYDLRARAEAARGGDGQSWIGKALTDYDAALQRNAADLMAHARKILLLKDVGRSREALQACNAALRHHPDDEALQQWRADLQAASSGS